MFFHSWAGIGHVMLSSVIVFALIVLTRFFRSRSRRGDDEISAAVRKAGLRSLADAQVVLENVGEWSVVAQSVGPRRLPCARASPALLRQRAPSTFRRCVAI
jgi:hypothetical protein